MYLKSAPWPVSVAVVSFPPPDSSSSTPFLPGADPLLDRRLLLKVKGEGFYRLYKLLEEGFSLDPKRKIGQDFDMKVLLWKREVWAYIVGGLGARR